VLVIAGGEKVREAQEAGADFVGGDEIVQKIMEGWTDYDAVIATPDMMRSAGKLGKVLGPRGLMPNPKTGTVTFEVAKAIKEVKAGKVEFRVDKAGIVHCPIGKIQFDGTEARRKRPRGHRGGGESQACGSQGQVREENYIDLDHGSGDHHRPDRSGSDGYRRVVERTKHRSEIMKNRSEKQQDLDKLKTELAKVSTVILSTFQGITVEDDTKLRRAVQAAGGKYKVVKNTLAERAGAGTPAENLLKN